MNKDKAIAAMKNWINVEDRLPEDTKPVWAIVKLSHGKLIPCVCTYTKGNEIEAEIDEGEGETYLNPGWYEETEQQRGTYDVVYFNRDVVMWSSFYVEHALGESTVSSAGKEVKTFQDCEDIIRFKRGVPIGFKSSEKILREAGDMYSEQFKSSPASTEISDQEILRYINSTYPGWASDNEMSGYGEVITDFVKWYRGSIKKQK